MLIELGVAIAVYAAGGLTGALIVRRKMRKLDAAPPALPPRGAKVGVSPERYEKSRQFYIDMYKESMQQYDRLVPWSAGGALVLSITLLHDVATAATGPGRIVMALAWASLLVCLAGSIIGHFGTSRIYSARRNVLDLEFQGDPATGREIDKFRGISRRSEKVVWVLNYVTAGTLVGGLALLAIFAYLSLG